MILESMNAFFDSRLDGYEDHMLNNIESARTFYPYTAGLLPQSKDAMILDLGCGTGLELDFYYHINPTARVTGIDLAEGMLAVLNKKHGDKNPQLICASYFDVSFGDSIFDDAVSIESLHRFTADQKSPLYVKLYNALKKGGYFILTDYFAKDDKEEKFFRAEFLRLKNEQGITDSGLYHYDTPLTVEHEIDVLRFSGFNSVEILSNWGSTYTIKATKH